MRAEGVILIEAGYDHLQMSEAIREEIAHALLDTPARDRRITRLVEAGKLRDSGTQMNAIDRYFFDKEEQIAKDIALHLGNRSIIRDISMGSYGSLLIDKYGWLGILRGKYIMPGVKV